MNRLPSSLKHLDRSPLAIGRLPGHLRLHIATQHSFVSLYNLAFTNWECSQLVDLVLSNNPYVETIREVLKHDKYEYVFVNPRARLFPPAEYENCHRKHLYLNQWIHDVCQRTSIRDLERKRGKLAGTFYQLKTALRSKCVKRISDLWKEQQRLGPGKISLQSISDQIWREILQKASTVSATRLARTRSSVLAVLDDYMQSIRVIRMLLEYTRMHPNNRRVYRYERLDFEMHNLLQNSYFPYCWLSLTKEDGDYIFSESKKYADSKDVLRFSTYIACEQLGHGSQPEVQYELDEEYELDE